MSTAKSLVENAFYLSLNDEVWQPAIETGMMTSGLTQLNFLLDELRDKIPYTFQYEFTDVSDLQNTQFVMVDSVTYSINGVVISILQSENLVRFREIDIVNNLVGIPAFYWFDESTQSIEVYPLPANPQYKFVVNGRRALGVLAMNDALPTNMPLYMQNAIQYELAFRFCGKYNAEWSQTKEITRQQLMKGLMEKQVIDLTPNTDILFPNTDANYPGAPWFYWLSGGRG